MFTPFSFAPYLHPTFTLLYTDCDKAAPVIEVYISQQEELCIPSRGLARCRGTHTST